MNQKFVLLLIAVFCLVVAAPLDASADDPFFVYFTNATTLDVSPPLSASTLTYNMFYGDVDYYKLDIKATSSSASWYRYSYSPGEWVRETWYEMQSTTDEVKMKTNEDVFLFRETQASQIYTINIKPAPYVSGFSVPGGAANAAFSADQHAYTINSDGSANPFQLNVGFNDPEASFIRTVTRLYRDGTSQQPTTQAVAGGSDQLTIPKDITVLSDTIKYEHIMNDKVMTTYTFTVLHPTQFSVTPSTQPPTTGDGNPIYLWMALLGFSGAALAGFKAWGKRHGKCSEVRFF